MEKKRTFIINTIYYLILILFVYAVVRYGIPIIMPFLVAWIVATILKNPAGWLARKLHIKKKPVVIFLVTFFYAVFFLLALMGGSQIISLIAGVVNKIPRIYRVDILPLLNTIFERLEVLAASVDESFVRGLEENYEQMTRSLGQTLTNFSMSVVKVITNYAVGLPYFIVRLVITIVATFFMAADYDEISSFFMNRLPANGRKMVRNIKAHTIEVFGVYIKSYSLIILITFTELCIGFLILRIPNAILIALCIAFFDILPVLGVGGVLLPWAVIAALMGNYKLMIGILLLYLVITVIRNTIEPRLVGRQIGLHPLATLLSMFVGAYLFGVIGLFGFPVTLSLLVNMEKSGVIHLFPIRDEDKK